jgi:hypothetical protein
MNKSALFSIVFFLLLCPILGAAQNVSWSTSTDYDHNCSIKFPGVPTDVFKNTSEGTKYTSYVIYGQSSYFLKVLDMKSETSNKKARASKTLHALAAKANGKVSEETDWIEATDIGVKGKFEISEEGKPPMLVLCNVIVIGKVQYEIITMTPMELYDPEFEDAFLRSFRFLN